MSGGTEESSPGAGQAVAAGPPDRGPPRRPSLTSSTRRRRRSGTSRKPCGPRQSASWGRASTATPRTTSTPRPAALIHRVRSKDPSLHLPLANAQAVQSGLEAAPVQFHPSTPLNAPALVLALDVGCSHYDGLFLALAIRLDGQVVTADRPFYDKIRASPHAAHARWVEDAP